jgi:hypothetical protein
MSNYPGNKQQNEKVELSPSQQDPGSADPNDFEICQANIERPVPAHGQWGDTAAEKKALCIEGDSDPGKSQPSAIPTKNTAR